MSTNYTVRDYIEADKFVWRQDWIEEIEDLIEGPAKFINYPDELYFSEVQILDAVNQYGPAAAMLDYETISDVFETVVERAPNEVELGLALGHTVALDKDSVIWNGTHYLVNVDVAIESIIQLQDFGLIDYEYEDAEEEDTEEEEDEYTDQTFFDLKAHYTNAEDDEECELSEEEYLEMVDEAFVAINEALERDHQKYCTKCNYKFMGHDKC